MKLMDTRRLSDASEAQRRSLEDTEDDRDRLCDAVLSAHFTAATQNARLEGLEARAAEVDVQMSEMKVELAEAEAQEAVQCVKWREKYKIEANEANAYREKAEVAEARLQSTAMASAQVSAEHLQIECLRTEVVERNAHWAVERERFLDEIYQLRVSVAEREGLAAGFELQVQKASEEAAQVTVLRCNEMEALTHARAEAGRAVCRAEASEAARALAEEKRLRATASVETMKVELQSMLAEEEAAVNRARRDARSEVEAVRQARMSMEELKKESEQNKEATQRLQALEEERQRDAKAAMELHADARQALENLYSFVGRRDNSSEKGSIENLKAIEAQFLAESKATAASESAAITAAQTEARKAAAAEKNCELLRSELAAQRKLQQDLHNELQALSSAAAAVRAVAVAKDDKIADLQAASRIMLAELANNVSPQPQSAAETRERSAVTPANAGTDKIKPNSLFDVMSNASSANTGSVGVWDSVSKVGESTISTAAPPSRAIDVAANNDSAQPPLFQAAAFLNAAASRAAAAASAVEAFIPFAPQPQSGEVDNSTRSAPTALSSAVSTQHPLLSSASLQQTVTDAANKSTSSQASESISRPQSEASGQPPPNWDAAQVAMTEQIRKDISLLRKALATSGIAGVQADDEVKRALLRATESMSSQYSNEDRSPEGKRIQFLQQSQVSALRSGSPVNRSQVGRSVLQVARQGIAASAEPTRQMQQPEFLQRSRSDSRPKTPPKQSLSHASNLDASRPSIAVVRRNSEGVDSNARPVALGPRSKQLVNQSSPSMELPSHGVSRSPLALSRDARHSSTAVAYSNQQGHYVSRSPDSRSVGPKTQVPIKESNQSAQSPGSVATPQGGRPSIFTKAASKVGYTPVRSGSPSVPKARGNTLQGVVQRVTGRGET